MQPITFTLSGDGDWGAEAGRTVTITGYTVSRYTKEDAEDLGVTEGDIQHVSVEHDSTWDVYTDSAFERAAQQFTGIEGLMFTEQGMQDDGYASMEV